MFNFPVPYPDELIYSVVARAGIHAGLMSPKQLLDEVFANRKVIATPDFPSHIKQISELYPQSLNLDVVNIIYKHTIFPLYAPFVPEDRRLQCLKWMTGQSKGAVHLALGAAASRVKQIRFFRYCPECLEQQFSQFGEFYWVRSWQVAGADVCPQHGSLHNSRIELHGRHRHQFFPLRPDVCVGEACEFGGAYDFRVAELVNELLSASPVESPSFEQWGLFYIQLAGDSGCAKGKNVLHDLISEKVTAKWTTKWLEKNGLLPLGNSNSCWLKSIFRKHRKSFSYLEHIVVLESLLDSGWNFQSVLNNVSSLKSKSAVNCPVDFSEDRPNQDTLDIRSSWGAFLKEFGVKKARFSGGAAIYAWLYRNDRAWLMKINGQYRRSSRSENKRVDWKKRDQDVLATLKDVHQRELNDLEGPRRSRNWYLDQLGPKATVETNLGKLPLTVEFFEKYCESVPDYQIRRIAVAIRQLEVDCEPKRRWKILRLAGLSDERIRAEAAQYLKEVSD
ncbi:TnsD family Tn7-like transposition protein [Maridesulfovibrio zosterae]|uniref:TnsD family Tn7-like transposition protein n=1 Tax=Maridesulfovibrio zosterae TaxID=82171 RepID=UPI0003F5C587|nr:TnsD family Tn7-like transposition protein [Maridesulfovibrio zosterae]